MTFVAKVTCRAGVGLLLVGLVTQRSSAPAALSFHWSTRRMYSYSARLPRTQRPWSAIARSSAPARRASVANPDRRECPVTGDGRPARAPAPGGGWVTPGVLRAGPPAVPCRATPRDAGPPGVPAPGRPPGPPPPRAGAG